MSRRLLVEVVADARSMRQQVLDRHVVADQRQIARRAPIARSSRARAAVLDEARDASAVSPFVALAVREPGVDACSGSRDRDVRARRRFANSTSSPRSTRTTPEKPFVPAIEATACSSVSTSGTVPRRLRRRNELGASTRVEDPPELQVHANLGRRLPRRRCVRPIDLRHAFVDRVRGESGTPEVSAEVVQKRRVVDEDTHGPQKPVVSSAARDEFAIPHASRIRAHEQAGLGCLEAAGEPAEASTPGRQVAEGGTHGFHEHCQGHGTNRRDAS